MKTAVSLPDDLFRDAEELATRLETSRSELFRRALQDFVARHDVDQIRETIDRLVAELGAEQDQALRTAGQKVMEETEW